MARPRQPWKRGKLLDTAMEIVSESGWSALSISSLARRAGITAGTVHYHFKGIDEVVYEVIDQAAKTFNDARKSTIELLEDPCAKLVTLIELGTPENSLQLDMLYDSIQIIRANDKLAALVQTYTAEQAKLYRSVIDHGFKQGVFFPKEDPQTTAENLVALEDAYDLYVASHSANDLERIRRNVLSYAQLSLGCELQSPSLSKAIR
jgi:AcrR family transcriptional regulator